MYEELPAHLRVMLGDLRGASPPREEILRRLHTINPNYRVTYVPMQLDVHDASGNVVRQGRPGLWFLHEVRPNNPHDHARRIAAQQRLDRFRRASVQYQARNAGIPEQCEDMMAGYWTIGSWPDQPMLLPQGRLMPFGSEAMFRELHEGEAAFRTQAAHLAKEAALDAAADEEALLEYDENPAFRAALTDTYRQAAVEDWALVFADRKTTYGPNVGVKPKESSDAAAANR